MEKDLKIQDLGNSLRNNCPILFLGAGFSREAVCDSGIMPTGNELCSEMIEIFIDEKVKNGEISPADYNEIQKYKIRELCSCIDNMNGNREDREKYLTQRLIGANSNEKGYHEYLVKYPWKKVYTVNIDDLVENIYEKNHKGYCSYTLNEHISDKYTDNLTLVKLHGDVRKPDKKYIFSQEEYNELITKKIDIGMNAFAMEFYSTSDIIFVGASLDEPDFEYYLQIYEDLQIKSRKNKLFFIEPYPTLALKQKAMKLNAVIIDWTTEKFLNFVQNLNYKPKELETIKLELNYRMIFRLKDTLRFFKTPYDSNIYQGFNCEWQDVFEKWTFENDILEKAEGKLIELLSEKSLTKCFCLFGGAFSGKSTLLKQLAFYMYNRGYELLEYRGRYLDKYILQKYIKESSFSKYVIVIDNASYYYSEIEKMFKYDFGGKEVVFLCASRTYYHNVKKYYLDGNCYDSLRCEDFITNSDAVIIEKTLKDKKYLSNLLDLPESKRIVEIRQKHSIVNLIIDLTYGKEIRRRLKRRLEDVKHLSSQEIRLLLEVAVFDKADIEYYPVELFNERYGRAIKLSEKIDIKNMKIVDFLRYDDRGLSLRNSMFQDELLELNKGKIYTVLKDLLIYISRYVHEGNNDVWVIIFQSLLKEKRLNGRFVFSEKEIGRLLYELKDYYEDISYYWLQLGIYEQQKRDYAKAFSHLKMAQHIQPKSFKIQHAIARNYLKYANSQSSVTAAKNLFETGERLMNDLIQSKEYYIQKAKPFSVSCYVLEKVRYIKRFDIRATGKELCELRDMLNSVYKPEDVYIIKAMQEYYKLLVILDKQNLVKITFGSPYYDILRKVISDHETEGDIL